MSWNGTLPPLLAGDIPLAPDWGQITGALGALTGPRDTYTPAWQSGGTWPALGNGTLTGTYLRAQKHTIVEVNLTIGSTTTLGNSYFVFTLPAGISPVSAARGGGTWVFNKVSVPTEYAGVTRLDSTTTFRMIIAAGGSFTPTVPAALAVNDTVRAQVFFDAI